MLKPRKRMLFLKIEEWCIYSIFMYYLQRKIMVYGLWQTINKKYHTFSSCLLCISKNKVIGLVGLSEINGHNSDALGISYIVYEMTT